MLEPGGVFASFASLADVVMEGRDRRYRNYGADSRVEFANLPLFGGMTHDLQAGIRYEEHFFTNQDREGDPGQILTFGNRGPKDGRPQKLEADAFAAFVQSAVNVTPSLTVTPGLRFAWSTSSAGVLGAKRGEAQSTSGVAVVWVTKVKSRMVS